MIKILFEGKYKKTVIAFKNSFNELTVGEFCDFILLDEQLIKALSQVEKLEMELLNLPKNAPNLTEAVIILDSEINVTERKIRSLKIEMLGILSTQSLKTVSFLINTKGITQSNLNEALRNIQKMLGSFSDWVLGVKLVNKFRFADYKKRNMFNITKMQTFEVFDMQNQTVLRDAAASYVAGKIDAINEELKVNRWDNLARFIAYVARPELEKEELSTEDKNAFFGGKKIVNLSVEDRLKAYNDLLAKTVEMRAPLFRKLPLVTAIGVYKQYFFLSRC